MTSPTRGRQILSHFRDLVIIVVGVLIALAADAWWQGREEARRELEYLLAIQSDMAEAGPALTNAIQLDSATVFLDRALAEQLRSGGSLDTSEPLRISMAFADVSVPSGTIRALIGTGDIRLVQSAPLRAQLIAFDALLDRTLTWRNALESGIIENNRELMREMEVARMARAGVAVGNDPLDQLRRRPGFISGLEMHVVSVGNRISLHRELLRSIEELNTSLSTVLADR